MKCKAYSYNDLRNCRPIKDAYGVQADKGPANMMLRLVVDPKDTGQVGQVRSFASLQMKKRLVFLLVTHPPVR